MNTSDPEDISNLFKSLQLERIVNMYQFDYKDKGTNSLDSLYTGLFTSHFLSLVRSKRKRKCCLTSSAYMTTQVRVIGLCCCD